MRSDNSDYPLGIVTKDGWIQEDNDKFPDWSTWCTVVCSNSLILSKNFHIFMNLLKDRSFTKEETNG